MRPFLDEDFLLYSEPAKTLYHKYAKTMPILDYHCHISPKEIAEDLPFETITQLWLSGDHYKWRQMRSNGIEEAYITGDASDFEKFEKWAQTLERAVGNPLYHWSHLELKRYFGCDEVLKQESARRIYDFCNEKIKEKKMSPRSLILESNVTLLCTTDDPIDDLQYHKQIKEDKSFPVQVLPAFRPEKAMNVSLPSYGEYIDTFSKVAGFPIDCFEALKEALKKRIDFFEENGCKISDHSLDYAMYEPASKEVVEGIFKKAVNGETISYEEELQFKTELMIFLAGEYDRVGWAMQLHYGVKRNNDKTRFASLGADTGFDCINSYTPSSQLADLLNGMKERTALPRTILYSLNPVDDAAIGTIIGCFQDASCRGKIQQGSAWWFNDTKEGIQAQMTSLANLGLLGNFIGMLTDSRSFLSYTRHEYFRRILCNLLGEWVERGEYPWDEELLGRIVKDVSYDNAVSYFQFHFSTT